MSIVSIFLLSFPTRRSSDLPTLVRPLASSLNRLGSPSNPVIGKESAGLSDLKSTRLNSSHQTISYGELSVHTGAKLWDRSIAMWVGSVSDRDAVIGVAPLGVTQKSWCIPEA